MEKEEEREKEMRHVGSRESDDEERNFQEIDGRGPPCDLNKVRNGRGGIWDVICA